MPRAYCATMLHGCFDFFRRDVLGFAFGFRDALHWNPNRRLLKRGRPKEAAFQHHFLFPQQDAESLFDCVSYLRRHLLYSPRGCQTFNGVVKVDWAFVLYEFIEEYGLVFSVFWIMELVFLFRID